MTDTVGIADREVLIATLKRVAKVGMVPMGQKHARSGIQNFDEIADAILSLPTRSPAAVVGGEVREALVFLKMLADEADNWADTVPDDYRPLCTEPRTNIAHDGSETVYSVGDLRKARALYAALSVQPAAPLGTEDEIPELSWWEAASIQSELDAARGEWRVTFLTPRGVDWRNVGLRLRDKAPGPSEAAPLVGEPVAWRWRNTYARDCGHTEWNYSGSKITGNELLEVEPLYATPVTERNAALEECAQFLAREYPDNVNTNAFCAAMRNLISSPIIRGEDLGTTNSTLSSTQNSK